MKKNWFYLSNVFLSATVNSYENAYRISVYHNAALQAGKSDTLIAEMLTSYEPYHLAFVAAYNHWKQQGGEQLSNTDHLEQLFKELSQKIKPWDIAIQNVYADTTPAYIRLLPHGRSPFQTGSQTQKLTALENLSTAIGDDKDLVKTKAQVDGFIGVIKAVFAQQKAAISSTGNHSNDVEAARVAMCIAQYSNLGLFIYKNAGNPSIGEGYFDLQHIRRNAQSIFTAQLKAGETHFIAKRSFAADDTIELYNTGSTSISFYMGNKKDAAPAETIVNIDAGDNKTITAKDLGDTTTLHYFIVKNADEVGGSFEAYLE
jgi:hypothetical protein